MQTESTAPTNTNNTLQQKQVSQAVVHYVKAIARLYISGQFANLMTMK